MSCALAGGSTRSVFAPEVRALSDASAALGDDVAK
jgi:hypothetical protein